MAGVLDTLPFEVGERPGPGDVVAVLLTGEQPYARVYVPERLPEGLPVQVLSLDASCSKPCPRHRAYKEFRH